MPIYHMQFGIGFNVNLKLGWSRSRKSSGGACYIGPPISCTYSLSRALELVLLDFRQDQYRQLLETSHTNHAPLDV